MTSEFGLGDSVKVTSGPLAGLVGEIVDVGQGERRLKVLVDAFEREVPVELEFDQVEMLRPPGDGAAGVREPLRPLPRSPRGSDTVEPEG